MVFSGNGNFSSPGEGTSVRYLVEEFARMCDGWKQGLAGGWYIISAALDSTCSLHLLRVRDGISAGGGWRPNGMVFETGVSGTRAPFFFTLDV